MLLPQTLLSSLKNIKGFDKKAFEEKHESGAQITSIRINPRKWSMVNGDSLVGGNIHHSPLTIHSSVPWSSFGYYLSERPSFTFDPLFHAGCYYVQEASGMFLEQALKQTTDLSLSLKVLDLCAAPGGKSTLIQSLISDESLLVSNEVIKNRANILKQNIIKWGSQNAVVTINDPRHFSKLKSFFDVMVVDAPCSGSGLFRKDVEAIDEWSEENVMLCCGRQKRIIAHAFACLKKDGLLIYSTCSYSKEEDEDIADWLSSELKMQSQKLIIEHEWNIVETQSEKTASFGYRFFPDKVKGEGFYIACFRKTSDEEEINFRLAKLEAATIKEKNIVEPWLNNKDVHLLKTPFIHALPNNLSGDYAILKNALNIQYAGVNIGEVMKDKLIPDHALALSNLLAEHIPKTELAYDEAIRYLQRTDINVDTVQKGWQLVHYQGHNLGWINALPNRINNYYPKELRILKQQDDSGFQK
jgi:16S rRNA C967 or C1407 C5-methylase (RsmB/RsmF family)/NOL1/NOP2/fmu family ribosome biogenesis protein